MLNLFRITLEKVKKDVALPSKLMNGGRHLSRKEMEKLKQIKPGDNVDKKMRSFFLPSYDGANIEIDGNKV